MKGPRLVRRRFWDESLYLERGLTLGFGSQPGWEWNPLYTDMYWPLGRFFSDPIDLYFAGRASAAELRVVAVWSGSQGVSKPFATSLRAMNTTSTQWRILTPERPLDLYLTNGRQILEPTQDATTFTELLDAFNVNALFDGILLRQADYASRHGFEEFLADPKAFGFTRIAPGSPFLVRQ